MFSSYCWTTSYTSALAHWPCLHGCLLWNVNVFSCYFLSIAWTPANQPTPVATLKLKLKECLDHSFSLNLSDNGIHYLCSFLLCIIMFYHRSSGIKYKNIHKIKQQDKINRMLMGMNIFQYTIYLSKYEKQYYSEKSSS